MIKENLEKVKNYLSEKTQSDFEASLGFFGETPSIDLLESLVKHYKGKYSKIVEKDLLEELQEEDINKFENDSLTAKIETFVSTKTVNKEKTLSWLGEHELDFIITENLQFPKGELTQEVVNELKEKGLTFSRVGTVPGTSLKKVISERLLNNEEVPPEDAVKITTFQHVKVKLK